MVTHLGAKVNNQSQNSIVNRPWLQGDTSVDMYGNPVETPHTTRTASAQSAADKAFFDTVRRYLPDGGEHSSPRRFTSADLPIDSEPRKVYNISDYTMELVPKWQHHDKRYQPGFHINYYGGLAQMKHIQAERGTENENN